MDKEIALMKAIKNLTVQEHNKQALDMLLHPPFDPNEAKSLWNILNTKNELHEENELIRLN